MLLSNFLLRRYLNFIYQFEYFDDVKKYEFDDFHLILLQKLKLSLEVRVQFLNYFNIIQTGSE